MIAADTNVIVRLIAQDDAEQLRIARELLPDGLWVSHVVLMETAWVLEARYGIKKEKLGQALLMLLGTAGVMIEDYYIVFDAIVSFKEGIQEALQKGKAFAVGFADCLILETARNTGRTLGTFDVELAKLDGTKALARR